MHLLAAQPGEITDGSEAVDLAQDPGDIVILSAADSELGALAAAQARAGTAAPSLRLANLMQLGHHLSVDLYLERVAAHARLVVVRLLGGVGYWSYGVEQLAAAARAGGPALALLPGDDKPDPALTRASTLPAPVLARLLGYFVHGGPDNFDHLLTYAAHVIDGSADAPAAPVPLMRAGLYWPGRAAPDLAAVQAHWQPDAPVAALVFYRALLQGGLLAPVDALIGALRDAGLNPLPLHVASLKDAQAAEVVASLFARAPPDVVVNATGFAVSQPGRPFAPTVLDAPGRPVLQAVFAQGQEAAWRDGASGLGPRDIAMSVALPEVDGRVLTRAVSFKAEARYDPATQVSVAMHRPVADRVAFTAQLAAAWTRLARTPTGQRRVALLLANYPNRDGRLANGVGLDTPASAAGILAALSGAGYETGAAPTDGRALIDLLRAGPTNAQRGTRRGGERLSLADYGTFFDTLPATLRQAVTAQWGDPAADPFVEGDGFRLPLHRFGHVAVAIQPARGYNIDPKATYHSPDLVPPHGYLAVYAWLRGHFDAHAVVHVGKHGNLEWLPGKALALSEACCPEAALGPLPHLYPFIVNDPGEGTQAKRRTQAVIVDHLTPPLTRAESYGPLKDLEALVDEYYDAAGLDPRRLDLLARQITELAQRSGLAADLGLAADEPTEAVLTRLDAYLCDLKELQIRDGLHVFGTAPAGDQRTDTLVALARVPRGRGEGGDASLLRALAGDLGLGFDPLDADLAAPWTGPRPGVLADLPDLAGQRWRIAGDTVERLEVLARALAAGAHAIDPAWKRTAAVLGGIAETLAPALDACGPAEMAALLAGLDGRFLAPGPSGAPSRGRPDVLPTGRNFYSVDTRTVPTPAAWQLGWQSACLLIDRHRQEHGDWPRAVALSAWGTSNMRTGGDDLAQALALLGVEPDWEAASRRVTGFRILPLSVLDRPRVDVTLRISGFFRDAFPAQIDLIDSAVRAVAALDEPAALNPVAARVAAEAAALAAQGLSPETAQRRAATRIFGAKPGAYGAGLQALMDEGGWQDRGDLAEAVVAWGGFAYGDGAEGRGEADGFRRRLAGIDAVVHNQDNREHDLLDSDDYYQFEGGLTAAAHHLSGRRPAVWHNDHSRPERPIIRSLEEEIARTVRGRAVNPKWIAGVMRHGYKGAFEMAATVDYLFAFAATTGAVGDQHFDAVFDAYIGDAQVRAFLLDVNPAAAAEIADKLRDALDRGLWRPHANTAYDTLVQLAKEGRTA